MSVDPILFFYAFVALSAIGIYAASRQREERRSKKRLANSIAEGNTEPASLHPVIQIPTCIGCGACVRACPEGDILGVMRGKAYLVDPSKCIGHGACQAACPTNSITLVFGTETRGVDIPSVGPDFQTNVPGVFIAGELGGMGLIRNAIEQGRQAIEEIVKRRAKVKSDMLDVVVVGAGPAGFSASLAAMKAKLRSVTLEQDTLGGTVAHYPRGKLVMTAPATLPIVGRVKFGEISKENLLKFWQKVERDTGVRINYNERVESIQPRAGGFAVKTSKGAYQTRTILLAIGRRGTPRRLDVPGEDLPKVVYRLIDPEQYRGRRVLVVGGGDSALEAAVSLSLEAGTTVTLSYRGAAFSGAKTRNRDNINTAVEARRLNVLMGSNVKQIATGVVEIEQDGRIQRVPNDDVIVCAGGILPTAFLKDVGIAVETKYGTA
jgi:thioredoxin reductase (NADPH)